MFAFLPQLLMGLAGAGGGVLKYLGDKGAAKKQRELQSKIARYSPWTGMQPDLSAIKDPNLFGSVLQGATGGLLMGSKMGGAAGAVAPAAAEAATPSAGGIMGAVGKAVAPASQPSSGNTVREYDPATGGYILYRDGKPIGRTA